MKELDFIRLQHMLDMSREALSFACGRKKEDLDTDKGLMRILERDIELIGEAATKISEEAKALLPNIEWKYIIGMRNRLVHVYYEVDRNILWDTVTNAIPELIKELEKLPELK
jgi:uncharacterized protein with HEPN domain